MDETRRGGFFARYARAFAGVELLAIIVLAGVIVEPYLVTRATTTKMTGMDPAMMQKETELAPGDPIPTVAYTLTKDAVGGYDLHITTTNFTFTPDKINGAAVADQGHAHLYIDGELSIILSPWQHVDAIAPGTHSVMVSLNANDHSVFAENGVPIEATSTLVVPPVE